MSHSHRLAVLILAAGFAHVGFMHDAAAATLVDCTVPNAIGGTCPDDGAWPGAADPHDARAVLGHAARTPTKHEHHRQHLARAANPYIAAGQDGPIHTP